MRKFALLLSVWLVCAPGMIASRWSDCITEKYGRYAEAQAAWQKGLTDLITEVAPQYAEVAELYRADQLHAIEESQLAVEYLALHEPAKLKTRLTLPRWLNLDEADRLRIASQNERYAELLRLGKKAMDRPPHPDGDDLRRYMRSEITRLTEYRKLLETFTRLVQEADDIQCE